MSGSLVYADPASRTLLELLERLGPSDVPVLIRGESGTGKEVVARHLHELSGRTGPFRVINCGAMADLTEDRPPATVVNGGGYCESWFAAADRGTLFLDEIGSLPLHLQAKLVRSLQAVEATRASKTSTADVRVITATTGDLTDTVASGNFRVDLLYRLRVAQVRLLPLRQRKGDIAPLAEHFIRCYAGPLKSRPPALSRDALMALAQHSWPGNVRELENVIRLALVLAPAQQLESEHLRLGGIPSSAPEIAACSLTDETPAKLLSGLLLQLFRAPGAHLLEQLEGQVVTEAFHFTGRNQVHTAALLGITRNMLRTLLKKHRLHQIRPYSSGNSSPDG